MREQLARSDNIEEIKTILNSIDDVNAPNDEFYGDAPLIWAAFYGRDKVVKALLQHPQIDPNCKDENGNTAIIWAAICGYDKVVTILLQHPQTDPNFKNEHGNTAIVLAASYGRDKVVTILLQHPQTNLNLQNKDSDTALMLASKRGHKWIVSIIIKENLRRSRISEATINQTSRILHQDRYGTNRAGFFAGLPDDINKSITALTGNPNVHNERQAIEIATAGYRSISPQPSPI